MSYRFSAQWREGAAWITSYGNGVAYFLADTATGKSVFLQGEAATQWREDYDAACDHAGSFAECFVLDTIAEHNQEG